MPNCACFDASMHAFESRRRTFACLAEWLLAFASFENRLKTLDCLDFNLDIRNLNGAFRIVDT